jgi:hypothetical protein
VVTPRGRRTRIRHDVATRPRSPVHAFGVRALLLPALSLLLVASTLLSACHSAGVSSVAQVPAPRPCVGAHEMSRRPIDGVRAAIGPGGRLALGSRIGPVFALQRDAHGSVLPTKFLWLVKTPAGTPLAMTARALKTSSLIDWVVTVPTTSRTKSFRAVVQPLDPRRKSQWGDVPSLLSIRTPGCYEVVATVQRTWQTFRLQATN